ncbi:MAG: ABC transporter permease [Acidimicrobiales bacterium]|nr:ABC transporter permease [Acidimicrobiales bacterium]
MIGEIARREILVRTRTRAFQISSAVLLAAAIAGPILALAFAGGGDGVVEIRVGVVAADDSTPASGSIRDPGTVIAALAAVAPDPEAPGALGQRSAYRLEPERFELVAAEQALLDGELEVVVVLPESDGASTASPTLVWHEEVDPIAEALVGATLGQVGFGARAAAVGLDPVEAAELVFGALPERRVLEASSQSDDIRFTVGFISMMLTFVAIQTYGALMVMSVIEEKSTRVVEVLLAQIRPRQLLAGKTLGNGVLALGQFLVVLIALGVAMALTSDVDIPSSLWGALPLAFVTFVLGFMLYALMFAAAGSLLSRQEDSQQVLLPMMVPLFVAYITGIGAAQNGAESGFARLLSLFPLTSPMLLPVRLADGEMPTWELVLALVLLMAAIVGVLVIAERIYSFALLRTGTRVSLRDAMRRAG